MLQSDDEEPGLGYTHTLVSTHNWDIVHIGLSDRRI